MSIRLKTLQDEKDVQALFNEAVNGYPDSPCFWSEVSLCESAAESGDVESMVILARILFSGVSEETPVPDIYHSAYYWFAKAQELSLEESSSSADLHIGMNCQGITKNIFEWLQKEVHGENDDKYEYEYHEGLHYLLSEMFRLGIGTEVDLKLADGWLRACGGDMPENKHILDAMIKSMI